MTERLSKTAMPLRGGPGTVFRPRGFADHAGDPHAEFVRLTQILAYRTLPISCFLDGTAAERAVEAVEALAYLYGFIDEARARFG